MHCWCLICVSFFFAFRLFVRSFVRPSPAPLICSTNLVFVISCPSPPLFLSLSLSRVIRIYSTPCLVNDQLLLHLCASLDRCLSRCWLPLTTRPLNEETGASCVVIVRGRHVGQQTGVRPLVRIIRVFVCLRRWSSVFFLCGVVICPLPSSSLERGCWCRCLVAWTVVGRGRHDMHTLMMILLLDTAAELAAVNRRSAAGDGFSSPASEGRYSPRVRQIAIGNMALPGSCRAHIESLTEYPPSTIDPLFPCHVARSSHHRWGEGGSSK